MKVEQAMNEAVHFVRPDMNLAESGQMMERIGGGVLPVVDESSDVVGVVTDRDICLVLARGDIRPSEVRVRDIMGSRVYRCSPDDDVEEAMRVMRSHRVRRLPVVDQENTLQGILSLDDLVILSMRSGGKDPPYDVIVATFSAINLSMGRG